MCTWNPALFADELALDVRHEYSALLSVGKTSDEAEKLLCDYYSAILDCGFPDEGTFWFALAHCEWNKGRLSEFTKSKALSLMESDLAEWDFPGNQKNYNRRKKVLADLKSKLLSPMPAPKKLRKPTVHHCPWPVGSLLSYRIVTSANVQNHSCFGKYALLRVIKIQKYPVSILAPSEYYDETMLVGLYGWIGDELPDPGIANELEFIPIKHHRSPDYSLPDGLSEETRAQAKEWLSERTERCAALDWLPKKDAPGDITCLGRDESFQEKIPDFFDTSVMAYSMSDFFSFDVTLANCLEPYLR